MLFATLALLVPAMLSVIASPGVAAPRERDRNHPAETIVELAPGTDPTLAAAELGVTPRHVYTDVITGFAAELPADAIARVRADRRVIAVEPDRKVRVQGKPVANADSGPAVQGQRMPTGVARIGTPEEPTTIDVDVAVVDTGVGPHNDLNIVGGYSCVSASKPGKQSSNSKPVYSDGESHGTHVAGIIGAKDNDKGVVGVAPGARIWAVRVLNSNGTGSWSDVVCGLDWVYKQRNTIDLVNMSLAGNGEDTGTCTDAAVHKAICRLVRSAGIPVVVAAGNQSKRASTRIPAAYSEVIAVSAFSDSDSQPGQLGPDTCYKIEDDSFWLYSNYGDAVDIAAPGDCIISTVPGGLATYSGTSMATPHVTAAIARYLALENPAATPDDVRTWLLTVASRSQQSDKGFTGGKSSEPALWLGA